MHAPYAQNICWHAASSWLVRFALGHFDDHSKPRNPYRRIPASVVGSPEHLALAQEAAAKVRVGTQMPCREMPDER